MQSTHDDALARALATMARPLRGDASDVASVLDVVGDARFVLIGESTHGTHDFYRLRAEITKRLIVDQGFAAVAAEADWPDAQRVNWFVRGVGDDRSAGEALADFRRFPAWMWRNADVLDFVGWLRAHNESLDPSRKVGFYGLDLYSLHASMGAVLGYLDRADPQAAMRARHRYACFDHFGEDPQSYGYATSFGLQPDCEHEAIEQMLELREQRTRLTAKDGLLAEDSQFEAEQNARVVRDAERYYRAMFRGRASSWNLRDTHMADTLDALHEHLRKRWGDAKIVVWAHNSHVGDARATQMGEGGEVNIGQLARERHPGAVRLVGFSTHSGTVTAASDWDAPTERKTVRPGLPGSYEALFHEVGIANFMLRLDRLGQLASALDQPRLQRAIGVIYRPETERVSHYFHTRLAAQFDVMLHLDRTCALEPLERVVPTAPNEDAPETFPTGM